MGRGGVRRKAAEKPDGIPRVTLVLPIGVAKPSTPGQNREVQLFRVTPPGTFAGAVSWRLDTQAQRAGTFSRQDHQPLCSAHAAIFMFLGLASFTVGTAAATEIDCYSGNGATYNGTWSRTATGAGAAQTTPAHSSMPAVHAMRLATYSVEIRLCRSTRCCRHGVRGMGTQQATRRCAHAGPLAVRPLGAVAQQPALELLPQPKRRLATMVLHRRRLGLLRHSAMPNRERYTDGSPLNSRAAHSAVHVPLLVGLLRVSGPQICCRL